MLTVLMISAISIKSYSQDNYFCPDLPLGKSLSIDGQDSVVYNQEEYRQAVALFACSRKLTLSIDTMSRELTILKKHNENLMKQRTQLERKIDLVSRQLEFQKLIREEDKEYFNKRLKSAKTDKAKVGIIAAVSGAAVGIIAGIIIMVVASK